jgi:hypothetical protein
MTKSKTVAGMKIELRTGREADLVSEVLIDGVKVGCDALLIDGCDGLFNELVQDKTGEKARYVKEMAA